ncbi:neutral amino acid transporter B(0)-like isoform X2 [Dermacentor albipictus]|uniref:neutral amino acid transporter B(0)-like isoform X2 n=1 Tax=Dermacentor albipictus TaxID=60249 RepID=UPI0031FD41AF
MFCGRAPIGYFDKTGYFLFFGSLQVDVSQDSGFLEVFVDETGGMLCGLLGRLPGENKEHGSPLLNLRTPGLLNAPNQTKCSDPPPRPSEETRLLLARAKPRVKLRELRRRRRLLAKLRTQETTMVERKAGDRAGSEDDEDGGSLLRMSENSLNLCLLGAAVGGMTLGWHIRNHGVSARLLQLIDFPGELYMRMLECLVMPVVASSIVAGLGSVDIMLAGQIGLLAMLYFVVATGMASAIGIGVALVLGPQNEPYCRRQFSSQIDGFLDLLRNLFPDNYLAACLVSSRTHIAPQNDSGLVDDEHIYLVMNDRTNILGLLSVSVMLGAVLSVTASESDSLLNLFVGLSNATVTVSQLTAWVSPVGVFFLVATRLSQMSELHHAFVATRTLLLVSVAALAAYGLGLLPVLYVLVTRKDARHFLRITCVPAMKAFRSASRTESVPGTIEALEDLAGLEPRVVRFVIPVGANVSMSGTAVVAAATAVVIARLDGIDLGAVEAVIIGTTVVLASLGAASIPNSSVLTVLMILMALQVSSRNISLVFVIDWAVDRFRTTVNIYSDSVGSAIVQQFSPLETLEDSVEETSAFQAQAVPKPVPPPPKPKPEPEPSGSGSRPEGEPNREAAEEPKLLSGGWIRRRLSRFPGFPRRRKGTRAEGALWTPSSTSSASSRASTSRGVLLPPSDGSVGAPAEIAVAMAHANDADYGGKASPLPQGIAVVGGWPTAGFRPFEASDAPPSFTASTQDGRDDKQAETAPITCTAAADGTGSLGDVSSGRSRRHRHQRRRTKEAKNAADKALRRSSKAGAHPPRPRRSKKNREKSSLPSAMPDAVSAVPDEALPPLASVDAEHAAPDLGGEASRRSSTGTAARPVV